MTRRSTALALLVLSASVFGLGGDDAATLKASMQAGMNKYIAAWKKKDSKTTEAVIRAHFSKDFKASDSKGKALTLDEWIAQDKMQMAMVQSVKKMSLTMDKVVVKGSTATSQDKFMADFVIANPDPNSKAKTAVLHVEGTSASTLKKIGGKWMFVSMKESATKMLLDGKPFGG